MASGLQVHYVYTGCIDARRPQFQLPIYTCISLKAALLVILFPSPSTRGLRLLISLNAMAYSQIYHTIAIKKRQTPTQKVVSIFFISFIIFP